MAGHNYALAKKTVCQFTYSDFYESIHENQQYLQEQLPLVRDFEMKETGNKQKIGIGAFSYTHYMGSNMLPASRPPFSELLAGTVIDDFTLPRVDNPLSKND